MSAVALPRGRPKRRYLVRAWSEPKDSTRVVPITAYTNDQARRYGPRLLLWNLGVRATRVHVWLEKEAR